jgi:hypothetical protein
MTSPDLSNHGLFGWRGQSAWQFLLLLAVIGFSMWMVSHMRKVVNPSRESEKAKVVKTKEFEAEQSPHDELPKPRERPFMGYNESNNALPDAARESYQEACVVLRRAINSNSTSLLSDCVRHPSVTMMRVRSMSPSRQVVPALPLIIGPQFGITGDLLLTTIRLANGNDRAVVLEKTSEGYKLDWESFAGWCETDFDGLQTHVGMKVHPKLMRVRCQPTSARTPFPEQKGIAIVISHPAEAETLRAFVSEEALQRSPAGAELKNSSDGPFTLLIKPDRDTIQHGWVRVDEVICSGWVTDR